MAGSRGGVASVAGSRVTARRDAVVLVVAARGWSCPADHRPHPRPGYTEPVTGTDEVGVPMTSHGLTCPSCALTRWLRVLTADNDTSGLPTRGIRGAAGGSAPGRCAGA